MKCQVCASEELDHVISLGYMPPVNWMEPIGSEPSAQTWLPTDLKRCPECDLVQLGYVADSSVVFPPHYPYTSGSTRLLRDNFRNLAAEVVDMGMLRESDKVLDIGSNDGTLLRNFKDLGMEVLGVEPTDVADKALESGIPTYQNFFSEVIADNILGFHGQFDVITCCNCFAHIPDVHDVMRGVKKLLRPGGSLVTESHYLMDLLRDCQYDAVYHEHLRYYSLRSLENLFARHDMTTAAIKYIPTHGGSIRVYALERNPRAVDSRAASKIDDEPTGYELTRALDEFRDRVVGKRRELLNEIHYQREHGRLVGIGAPSRASVVISYCRLDSDLIDYVCELPGSMKIGRYMPGTSIPVVEEARLLEEQPEAAVVFSWHLFEEIERNLRDKGYRGNLVRAI